MDQQLDQLDENLYHLDSVLLPYFNEGPQMVSGLKEAHSCSQGRKGAHTG